ncbi:MAG: hypothetical protein MPN21_16175 [Thermoanaerobaculia bacterium]|nr:hypothetical protein [Thermoanaerobaculia bacterium]
MKWVLFFAFAATAVPASAVLVAAGGRYRAVMLAVLAVTPFFGDLVNVNIMSMENYRGPDRGFEISMTDLLGLGMALGLLVRPTRLRRWPPGLLPCLLLFLLASLGLVLAPRPLVGAFTLWKALRLFVLFWVVFELVEQGIDHTWLLRAWAALGCLSALLVLKQKYSDGIYRIMLLFDHSNTVPLYLNLVMPIVLLWALAGPTPRSALDTWLGTAGALGMVGAVTMTYSRAGIAIAAACVASVLLIASIRRPTMRSIGGAMSLSLLGVVGLALVSDSLIARFLDAPKSSEEARHEFNVAAADMASDHLLGVGINQFSLVLTEDARYRRGIEVMANEEEAGVVHHVYWLTAAELGYLGLGLFLVVLGRYWLLAWQVGLGGSGLASFTGLGAGIGFGAVHLQGLLEWALRISPVSYQLAIVCGLVSGLAVRRKRVRSMGRRS